MAWMVPCRVSMVIKWSFSAAQANKRHRPKIRIVCLFIFPGFSLFHQAFAAHRLAVPCGQVAVPFPPLHPRCRGLQNTPACCRPGLRPHLLRIIAVPKPSPGQKPECCIPLPGPSENSFPPAICIRSLHGGLLPGFFSLSRSPVLHVLPRQCFPDPPPECSRQRGDLDGSCGRIPSCGLLHKPITAHRRRRIPSC